MASKIEAPVTGTEVDVTDPLGSGKNIVYGVLGIALLFAMMAGGQTVYNYFAQNTPDQVAPVEVF